MWDRATDFGDVFDHEDHPASGGGDEDGDDGVVCDDGVLSGDFGAAGGDVLGVWSDSDLDFDVLRCDSAGGDFYVGALSWGMAASGCVRKEEVIEEVDIVDLVVRMRACSLIRSVF